MTTTPTASPELPDLDHLEALARAANPGPWEWWTSNSVLRLSAADGIDGGVLQAYTHRGGSNICCGMSDRAFIAAANPAAVLALIALARRAQPEGEAPQAEPVASVTDKYSRAGYNDEIDVLLRVGTKLYAHPPAATLSPLCGAQHVESDEIQISRSTYGSLEACEAEYQRRASRHAESGKESVSAIAWAVESSVGGGMRTITKLTTDEAEADRYVTASQAQYAGCARRKIELCDRAALAAQQAAAPGNPVEFDGIKTSAPGTPEAPQTAAARDVLAERQRQVGQEGWTPAHDDKYQHKELAHGAAAYALVNDNRLVPRCWPWAVEWWKPRDERHNLVRAGALVLAEIERLDRAAAPKGGA